MCDSNVGCEKMSREEDIIVDHKRNLVYRVKNVMGGMLIIERVIPSSHALTNLDFAEDSFDGSTPGLVSLS